MNSCPFHRSDETTGSTSGSSSPDTTDDTTVATAPDPSERKRSVSEMMTTSTSESESGSRLVHVDNHSKHAQKKPKQLSSLTLSASVSASASAPTSAPKKDDETTTSPPLTILCVSKLWLAATNRAISHPHEAQFGYTSSARSLLPLDHDGGNKGNNNSSSVSTNTSSLSGNHMASSPLALATRFGAPSSCVKAILNAEKRMVRRCIPNRGTPLHEAIMLFPNGGVGAHASAGTIASIGASAGTVALSLAASATSATSVDNSVASASSGSGSGSADPIVMTKDEDPISEYVKILRMLIEADESLEQNERESEHEFKRRNSNNSCSNNNNNKRATLMQDVDGNVPLHLLIRQAFYHYLGEMAPQDRQQQAKEQQTQVQHPIFTIAQELIQSSPEAVSIPDCTEFEETPLILALKSSVYANEQHAQHQQLMDGREQPGDDFVDDNNNNNTHEISGGGIDFYNSTLERKIFDICKIMLQSSPAAASRVMVQNGYTAVHSAVFHGRCCDTIRLLLTADEVNRQRIVGLSTATSTSTTAATASQVVENEVDDSVLPATMQANKFGELPLHFAAMRGECTRSIALLSKAAPWAVLRRDVKLGLTPLHWLWVRFMDSMVERFGERSFNEPSAESDRAGQNNNEEMEEGDNAIDDIVGTDFGQALSDSSYFAASASSNTSQQHRDDNGHIHFDLEYHIRTEAIDPPVHYTRMRHIVPEHVKLENALATRVVYVLRRVRERHKRLMETVLQLQKQNEEEEKKQDSIPQDGSSQIETTDSKVVTQHKDIGLEAASNSSVACPYSRLRVNANSQMKCPFGNSMNSLANNVTTLQNQNSDMSEIQKKCPFRCPFVFDSYPLNEDLIRPAEEEALREEQVISLFWAKVTSLLQAAALVVILDSKEVSISSYLMEEPIDYGKINMLHTACSAPCPFSIVRLCLELYPEQLMERDTSGKLPLHHAALRSIDPREINPKNNRGEDNEGNTSTLRQGHASSEGESDDGGFVFVNNMSRISANNIIQGETVKVLELLISSSPSIAARTFDIHNRLPLHCFIDTMMKSVAQYQLSWCDRRDNQCSKNVSFYSVAPPLQSIMNEYPDALECVDGKTNLYPFMQASAAAAESYSKYGMRKCSDNVTLSLVYSMLLEKPSIINMLL